MLRLPLDAQRLNKEGRMEGFKQRSAGGRSESMDVAGQAPRVDSIAAVHPFTGRVPLRGVKPEARLP